jgi:D-alanyl-D-alanine carboxypeptidase/D-alanyl-D-alanine-endopeptidase (penicillin-binding protein 4)
MSYKIVFFAAINQKSLRLASLNLLLASLLLILFNQPVRAQTSLPELNRQIDALVKQSGVLESSSAGVYIKEVRSGQIVYQKNGDTPLTPSSNMKVMTSAAAFMLLGPDYRYKTYIYGGPLDISRGVMESSLYLVGSGDPTFTEPFTENPTEVFEQFAKRLYRIGLRKVKGDLIGDDSVFDRDFVGKGWKSRYILEDYAAECGGLSLNANLLRITIEPQRVLLFPPSPAVKVVNTAHQSGYTEIQFKREADTGRIVISGTFGGATQTGLITVHNPPLFTLSAFSQILANKGINVMGKTKLIDQQPCRYSYKSFLPYCSHESPKLYLVLKYLNKESDNFLANQVFRTLGAVCKGKGSLKNSESVIKEFMEKAGIDTTGFQMADGSGLSSLNRVTPKQLAETLIYMHAQPDAKKYIATLPQAGVDGTLKYRLSGAKVFAKTGTINENSSLSGYVTTAFGQTLVFSIITNNHKYGQGSYKGFEDQIVYALSRWSKEI